MSNNKTFAKILSFLNELNKMLNEMKQGEDAVKRLAELDASSGLQDPADVARRMRNNNKTTATAPGALDDSTLAQQRIEQAEKMEREAKGLLAEAKRLKEEAASLTPAVKVKPVKNKKEKNVA